MRELLKRILAKTPLDQPLRNWVTQRRQGKEYAEWLRRGKAGAIPHLAKQRTLAAHAERFGLKVLVETGTYYGDMVEALKNRFDRIYSIELSDGLHARAARRFRGDDRIVLVHGDSGVELGKIVARLDGPALFWLDGHYSAGETARGERDTPIFEELRHILTAPDREHVIVVDDAHCFGTDPAYPTIEELGAFVRSKRPGLEITVEEDSIRITPRKERPHEDDPARAGVPRDRDRVPRREPSPASRSSQL